ncbi:MAG: hypothetical protein ACR2RV_28810 [Verrucomicrobiales bacterium]
MRILSFTLVGCVFLLGACSKKTPSHPDAGLRLLLDGEELARSGFYSEELVRSDGLDEGVKISIVSRTMDFKGYGHHVVIGWEADYGAGSDEYTFSLIVDGTHSGKKSAFLETRFLCLRIRFRSHLRT